MQGPTGGAWRDRARTFVCVLPLDCVFVCYPVCKDETNSDILLLSMSLGDGRSTDHRLVLPMARHVNLGESVRRMFGRTYKLGLRLVTILILEQPKKTYRSSNLNAQVFGPSRPCPKSLSSPMFACWPG